VPEHKEARTAAVALFASLGEAGVIARMAASAESLAHFPDATAFVDNLYVVILGRPSDPAAAALAGIPDWAALAGAFVLSPESLTRFVQAAYVGYLGREADPTGLATAVASLSGGQTFESAVVGILASPEFVESVVTGR
jgi:hypothetical protein